MHRGNSRRNGHDLHRIEPLEPRTLLSSYGMDSAFGDEGVARATFGTPDGMTVRMVQEVDDSKILVVAEASYNVSEYRKVVAARFDEDGALDESFGDGGVMISSFNVDYAEAAAVQSDGKLVVVGNRNGFGPFVARFNDDGTLDDTFAGDGVLDFGADIQHEETLMPQAVVAGSDDSITIVGFLSGISIGDLGVVRVTSDGALDATFDDDGVAILDGQYREHGLAVDDAGRTVIAGDMGTDIRQSFVARFTEDGQPDATFDTDGIAAFTQFDGRFAAPAVQEDGAIVLALGADIVRLTETGALDTSFSDDGVAPYTGAVNGAASRIYLDGELITVLAASGVMQYNSDGSPDLDFSEDGLIQRPSGAAGGIVSLDGNWNVLDAGAIETGSDVWAIAVSRYEPLEDVRLEPLPAGEHRLFVAGTADGDEITAVIIGADVHLDVNGDEWTFPSDQVTVLTIRTSDGDDEVSVLFPVNCEVVSGNGADTITTSNGLDSIDSGAGDDSVTSGNERDSVVTGDGNDTVVGGNGSWEGGVGIQNIQTGAGDDVVFVGGSSYVFTAEGNDSVVGSAGDDTIHGGGGNNTIGGGGGNDSIFGGADGDTLFGGPGQDTITANGSLSDGVGGTDSVDGGAGNDFLYYARAGSTLWGDDGDDYIEVAADVTVYGDAGNDRIRAGGLNHLVFGGDGNDDIRCGDGNDTIWGEIGYDSIKAGGGNDLVNGGAGADRIWGQEGNDNLYGRRGNDCLDGGPGNDRLIGDGGFDKFFGGAGGDRIWAADGERDLVDGGDGDDVAAADGLLDELLGVEGPLV